MQLSFPGHCDARHLNAVFRLGPVLNYRIPANRRSRKEDTHDRDNRRGIPQGSPISLLANFLCKVSDTTDISSCLKPRIANSVSLRR
jgi:hypothetical protein